MIGDSNKTLQGIAGRVGGGKKTRVTWTQRVRFYKTLIECASYYAH